MNILITGVAGFLGSHISEKYVKEGHIVYGVDDLTNGNLNNIRSIIHKDNFKFIKGDVRDESLFKSLYFDIDAIIHLAAQIHVDYSVVNPKDTFEINVFGTLNILNFARMRNIKKIIYASSSEVYGSAQAVPMNESHSLNAEHPYGASKVAAEQLCLSYNKTYSMEVNIVRCFNFFGPRQRDTGYGGVIAIFTKRVFNNQPPIVYGNGLQTRDYMYVKDTIKAFDLILKSKDNPAKSVMNFGSGKEITIKEIAQKVIQIFGKENELKPVFVEPRPIEVQRQLADTSKANKLLGFKPDYSFDEGLIEYIDWVRNYKSELWKF